MSDLPARIRAEVKFTTGTGIGVPRRELEALPAGKDCAAVVAALFLCGDGEIDGHWQVVDSEDSFGRGSGESISVQKDQLARAHLSQPALNGIRAHLKEEWPRFLYGYIDLAVQGHEATKTELKRLHEEGCLSEKLPGHKVLDAEHSENMRRVVKALSESPAGMVFQDLFAYALAMAGYAEVQINPVGVPDVELSGLKGYSNGFAREEVKEIVAACRAAGKEALAEKVEKQWTP